MKPADSASASATANVAGRRHALGLVLLAVVFTLLNAVKPLTIDDTAYYYYAAHIAEHPLEPYGFQIFWWQWPQPANEVLAPPLLPCWWALGIRLFGDSVFLWKLWLLPFSLLFVLSLYFLAHRFARGLELPLVCLTVLSPTFLPSFNLMLDVPALALSLTALVLFFRACDRSTISLALLAGLVAGLAMETKYTGFLAPMTMVLYALLSGRKPVWLSLIAVLCAGFVFGGWESFIAQKYGQSHFLLHFERNRIEEPLFTVVSLKLAWFGIPLLVLVGGVGPALALLGLAGLGRSYRTLVEAAVAIFAVYLLVAGFGSATIPAALHEAIIGHPREGEGYLALEQVLFAVVGVAISLIVLIACWAICEIRWSEVRRTAYWHSHRDAWFLVLWLGLEVAGYFALTPFAAVRRTMGVVVVGTLVVGCLAARTCQLPERRHLVQAIAFGNIALGMVFYLVDLHDARAEKDAALASAQLIREHDDQERDRLRREFLSVLAPAPETRSPANSLRPALWLLARKPNVWYVGHWGFQYYAERAGMVPVVPDRSQLLAGDWLVVPGSPVTQQMIDLRVPLKQGWLEPAGSPLEVQDLLPLRTVMAYYGTSTGVPLEHLDGARVTVTIYRVKRNFVAVSE